MVTSLPLLSCESSVSVTENLDRKKNVNDIFVLFRSPHELETFNEHLNTKHANLEFTNETEINWSWPLLDVLMSQNNKGFTTTVYNKPTFSGVYSNFNRFIAGKYKQGLIFK